MHPSPDGGPDRGLELVPAQLLAQRPGQPVRPAFGKFGLDPAAGRLPLLTPPGLIGLTTFLINAIR
jgi:hypothetical protein